MAERSKTKRRSEHRWPAATALLIALAMYATSPAVFLPWLHIAVVAIGLVLLVPLLIVNPVRFEREWRWSRRAALTQALILFAANQVAIVVLVTILVNLYILVAFRNWEW